MTRLGVAMGAKEKTFSGLSGIGDLLLTCTSNLSRNYTVGTKLGQGMKLEEILNQMKSVAEGVSTAESAFELSKNMILKCLLWSRFTGLFMKVKILNRPLRI